MGFSTLCGINLYVETVPMKQSFLRPIVCSGSANKEFIVLLAFIYAVQDLTKIICDYTPILYIVEYFQQHIHN